SKFELLEWIYSSDIGFKIHDNLSYVDTLKFDNEIITTEELSVGEDNIKDYVFLKSRIINIFSTKRFRMIFKLVDNKLCSQQISLTYENISDAVKMKELLSSYFQKQFSYSYENVPIYNLHRITSAKSFYFFKNFEEMKNNYERAVMVRLDMSFHKKDKYNVYSKETEEINVASIVIELSSYKNVNAARVKENELYLMNSFD